MKRFGNLCEAEFYDIVSRLQYGPNYDPRTDTKHYVHIALNNLEKQRAIHIENQKQNGVAKKNQVSNSIISNLETLAFRRCKTVVLRPVRHPRQVEITTSKRLQAIQVESDH
jgi:predicted DNA-binding protein (UPF0251 family)